jgi:hypothetical protein
MPLLVATGGPPSMASVNTSKFSSVEVRTHHDRVPGPASEVLTAHLPLLPMYPLLKAAPSWEAVPVTTDHEAMPLSGAFVQFQSGWLSAWPSEGVWAQATWQTVNRAARVGKMTRGMGEMGNCYPL